MTIASDCSGDEIEVDDSSGTETGMWPEGWRISPQTHGPAAIVRLHLRHAEQDEAEEVRLTWRVIDTFNNVCWPLGQDRSH